MEDLYLSQAWITILLITKGQLFADNKMKNYRVNCSFVGPEGLLYLIFYFGLAETVNIKQIRYQTVSNPYWKIIYQNLFSIIWLSMITGFLCEVRMNETSLGIGKK